MPRYGVPCAGGPGTCPGCPTATSSSAATHTDETGGTGHPARVRAVEAMRREIGERHRARVRPRGRGSAVHDVDQLPALGRGAGRVLSEGAVEPVVGDEDVGDEEERHRVRAQVQGRSLGTGEAVGGQEQHVPRRLPLRRAALPDNTHTPYPRRIVLPRALRVRTEEAREGEVEADGLWHVSSVKRAGRSRVGSPAASGTELTVFRFPASGNVCTAVRSVSGRTCRPLRTAGAKGVWGAGAGSDAYVSEATPWGVGLPERAPPL